MTQVKMEQDQYRAQLGDFKSNTAAQEQAAQNQAVRRNIEQLEKDLKERNEELDRERDEKSKMEREIESLRTELGKNVVSTPPAPAPASNFDAFGAAFQSAPIGQ